MRYDVISVCTGCVCIADHVVPSRDVNTTTADRGMTSRGEDVLDVIDQLSQTTSDEQLNSADVDDVFPL